MTATTLDDQVVLISGAAGGIGAATARRLIDRGARVVLADLDAETLEALAAEFGDRASAFTLDVTDPAACADAVAATLADHGGRGTSGGSGDPAPIRGSGQPRPLTVRCRS